MGAHPGKGEPVPRWCGNFAVTRLCPPSPSAPEFLAPSLIQGDWLQGASGELIPWLRCSTGDHRAMDPHPSCIQRQAPCAPGPMLTCASVKITVAASSCPNSSRARVGAPAMAAVAL